MEHKKLKITIIKTGIVLDDVINKLRSCHSKTVK